MPRSVVHRIVTGQSYLVLTIFTLRFKVNIVNNMANSFLVSAYEISRSLILKSVSSKTTATALMVVMENHQLWKPFDLKNILLKKLVVLMNGLSISNILFSNFRFLIFFDDGFAQYLPLHKLHHVYHTGM